MLLLVIVWARLGRQPAAEIPAAAEAATIGAAALRPQRSGESGPPRAEGASRSAGVPDDQLIDVKPAAVAVHTPTVDLPAVADLCADLARVLDGRDVPALLERTVKVLNAKGVVLWVIDTSGTFLRPLLLHGYPEKIVKRLGQLQVDADNLTSLAFRSLQAQSVNGTPDRFGAIAVPLVTGTGCVGVLAAELQRARSDSDTLSAAKMIAAQLAALAAPTGQESAGKAAG